MMKASFIAIYIVAFAVFSDQVSAASKTKRHGHNGVGKGFSLF
jgi:hypothetical protein